MKLKLTKKISPAPEWRNTNRILGKRTAKRKRKLLCLVLTTFLRGPRMGGIASEIGIEGPPWGA